MKRKKKINTRENILVNHKKYSSLIDVFYPNLDGSHALLSESSLENFGPLYHKAKLKFSLACLLDHYIEDDCVLRSNTTGRHLIEALRFELLDVELSTMLAMLVSNVRKDQREKVKASPTNSLSRTFNLLGLLEAGDPLGLKILETELKTSTIKIQGSQHDAPFTMAIAVTYLGCLLSNNSLKLSRRKVS